MPPLNLGSDPVKGLVQTITGKIDIILMLRIPPPPLDLLSCHELNYGRVTPNANGSFHAKSTQKMHDPLDFHKTWSAGST